MRMRSALQCYTLLIASVSHSLLSSGSIGHSCGNRGICPNLWQTGHYEQGYYWTGTQFNQQNSTRHSYNSCRLDKEQGKPISGL